MTPPTSSLWPILGGVRFFLALVVVVSHASDMVSDPSAWQVMFSRLSPFAAVLGFLVISGYSIAASLHKEPAQYYQRRAIRILPLYWLAVGFAAVAILPLGGVPTAWPDVAGNMVFLQGFTCGALNTNQVLWTLSIEVFFYLFAPLLARMSLLSLALIIAASAALFVTAHIRSAVYPQHLSNGAAVPLLAWSWLLGFAVFRIKAAARAGLVVLAVVSFILTIAPAYVDTGWPITIAIVAIGIAFAHRITLPRWCAHLLSRAGDTSYPLYLFHYPLFLVYYGLKLPPSASAMTIGVVLVAVMLDRFYDQPIKAVVRRMTARRIAAPVAAA